MGTREASELWVIATGVYEHVLHDVAAAFTERTGVRIAATITNAGGVAGKLEANPDTDLVMTSSVGIDALAAKGRVVGASKVDVGGMRLGLAVKTGSSLPDLGTTAAVRAALLAASVASIDPQGGGTSGPFIAQLFERLGIAEAVAARGLLCATGAAVAQAVASGRASLGLTQAAELIDFDGIAFAGLLPDELQLVTVYSAAIGAGAKLPAVAADFLAFITGPDGAGRLRRSGWSIPA
jgi:molybdate transport system substrate-binding protein